MNKATSKPTSNYRWLVWGIMALSYVVVFFHRMAAGVVKDDLIQSFNISATTFANLGATYFYAYMLMQIPAGILADTLGARKTVTAGTLLAGAGSILFGFAPTVAVSFLGRLLVGMGVSVVFICILKILSVWFRPEEFSTMSGITSFIGNMGGLLAQTPLALMVAVFTWRNTFMAIGLASILIAVLCYLIIRDYPAEMQPQDNSAASQQKKAEKPSGKTFLQVITNKHTWPGFFIFAGFFGAYIAFSGTWGVSYMMDVYGLSTSSAANYPMAATLGLMVGSILIGVISDRSKSRKKPMIVFGLCYLATWAILIFSNGGKPPIEILYPLFFAMGFFCATFILTFAVAKEVNHPEIAGVSTATVNTGGFLGAALLPALMGMYIDGAGQTLSAVNLYQNAFIYCFIAVVISTIAIFLIKETRCRNIWQESE